MYVPVSDCIAESVRWALDSTFHQDNGYRRNYPVSDPFSRFGNPPTTDGRRTSTIPIAYMWGKDGTEWPGLIYVYEGPLQPEVESLDECSVL